MELTKTMNSNSKKIFGNDCKKICKVVIEAYFEATSEYSFE